MFPVASFLVASRNSILGRILNFLNFNCASYNSSKFSKAFLLLKRNFSNKSTAFLAEFSIASGTKNLSDFNKSFISFNDISTGSVYFLIVCRNFLLEIPVTPVMASRVFLLLDISS